MKKLPYLLLGALALAGNTFGQTTATSDPVGFITVGLQANSDGPLSLPLHRTSALHTPVTAVSGNVITVSATLTASQFVYSLSTQKDTYYVRVVSTISGASPVKGAWYHITANTNSTITVDPAGPTLQASGLVANDVIEIVPYWTLDTLFPNGQGLAATSNIDSPLDQVGFMPNNVPGVNLQPAQLNAYITDPSSGLQNGWYNSGNFSPTGSSPITPDSYLFVRNAGAAKSITVTGGVPTSSQTSVIGRIANNQGQDNFTANPFPVTLSLAESRLFESGAFAPTPNIDSPQDLLLVFNGTETGANSQPSAIYFYSTDSANLGVGWFNAGTYAGPLDTSKLLVPGRAFIVRKAPGAVSAVAWKADPTY